jgi:hypothetical protein
MSKGIVGWIVALIAVAGLALLGGCGSSGEDSLSKAEFEKKAGAICDEAEEKRAKVVSGLVQEADPNGDVQAQQEQVIHKALPTYEEAASKIADLGAPEGQQEKVDALVSAMEEAAEKALADPHTAVVSNIFFRKADQLAQEYELSGCVI